MTRKQQFATFLGWCVAAWLATAVVLLVLAVAHPRVDFHWLTFAYLVVTVGFSLLAFATMGFDKYRAGKQGRRVSEGWLHALEFCGGWSGSLMAQRAFRHKTQKVSYQTVYWVIVVVHLLLIGWLCYLWWTTPDAPVPGTGGTATESAASEPSSEPAAGDRVGSLPRINPRNVSHR